MTRRIVLKPEAKRDILEAEEYLRREGFDAVRRFRERVAAALRRVRDRPFSFSVIWRDVRRAQVRPFKHGVFFVIVDDQCTVLGIIDLRRDPRTWRQRR